MQDYLREEAEHYRKLYPPINYKFMRTATKQHFCEVCGVEIHKNELYWTYKPNPSYDKRTKKKEYHKWRKRCWDHEPRSHEELKTILEE